MIIDKEIIVNGELLNCEVDFSRFWNKEETEVTIVFNEILHEGKSVLDSISSADLEELKERCEKSYQYVLIRSRIEREL